MKNRILISIIISVFSVLSILFFYNDTYQYFPKKSFSAVFITDTADGGNSEILEHNITEKLLHFSYKLKNKFKAPYCLCSSVLSNSGYFDLTIYDSIIIEAKGVNTKFLKIQILSYDSIVPKVNIKHSFRFNEGVVILDTQYTTKSIALDQINTPSWWYIKNHVPANFTNKHFNKSKNFEFVNAMKADTNITKSIYIKKILFKGKRLWLLWVNLIILFVVWMYNLVLFFKKYSLIIVKNRRLEYMQNYEKLDIEDDKEEEKKRIIDYISENYYNENLNLKFLSTDVGISTVKLTNIFKKDIKMNFKAYLNEVRLSNAVNLLKTTDNSIINIAMEVGYNNVSYFNKKFKDRFNISPMKFRKKYKNLDLTE